MDPAEAKFASACVISAGIIIGLTLNGVFGGRNGEHSVIGYYEAGRIADAIVEAASAHACISRGGNYSAPINRCEDATP